MVIDGDIKHVEIRLQKKLSNNPESRIFLIGCNNDDGYLIFLLLDAASKNAPKLTSGVIDGDVKHVESMLQKKKHDVNAVDKANRYIVILWYW